MTAIDALLEGVAVPRFAPVRQHFDGRREPDAAASTRSQISHLGLLSHLKPGASVAIGVGSRGIAQLPLIVGAVVDAVREVGGSPFIVPAMGSHGGATAEGQATLLEHLGVTERSVGAPVRASMDVVQLGSSSGGLPLFVDNQAAAADGIIAINRVKPHTSFHGPVESGLVKMLVIGFGKQAGADVAHALGFEHMATHLLDLSTAWLERLPLLFGVAVLENALDETARIVVLPRHNLVSGERDLIEEARRLMPSIPLGPLDVLVVDEIGKNISGVGMDPNITGRAPNQLVASDLHVERIVALRLSRATDGNAAGIGLADVTTAVLEGSIDRAKGYVNSLTSTTMTTIKLPMVMRTDELAIKAALKTSHARGPARAIRIHNTLRLDDIWVSEALLAEAACDPRLEVLGPPEQLPFDALGNLSL
jgi:hypothetical protein